MLRLRRLAAGLQRIASLRASLLRCPFRCEDRRILVHDAKSATQDRRERTAILFERDDSRRGKVPAKQRERLARRAAKLVDRLVGIAHDKDVGRRPREQREILNLRKVCVLN